MNTLLIEFNDAYFRDVAAAMHRMNAPLTYLVTSFPNLYLKHSEFNKVKIINEQTFHYADKIPLLSDIEKESLSQKLITECFELENLFMSITDRISFYPKTVEYRKQLYLRLLLYWDTFLKEKRIDTIIYPRVPHLGYGNIIYFLAKKMGIKVVIIRETLIADRVFLSENYMALEKIPPSFYPNHSATLLEEKIGKEWLDFIYKPSELMKINQQDNDISLRQNNKHLLRDLLNLKTLRSLLSLVHNPLERVFASPTFLEKPTNWLSYYQMILRYYIKNKFLYEEYQSLSDAIDLSKKYIYVALHYQPERTSMPEGGVFANQLLIIDILSKSIPKDWYLYVKEHPNQFSRMDIRKMNFRDSTFYQTLKMYKNIKLVPISTNSQKIIAHSQTTATLTGSTGWETLLQYKPVLTFTPAAWFSSCQSCYVVTSVESCKLALTSIKKADQSQVRSDVLRFILYYKDRLIDAPMSYEFTHVFSQPYPVIVKNLATALTKAI